MISAANLNEKLKKPQKTSELVRRGSTAFAVRVKDEMVDEAADKLGELKNQIKISLEIQSIVKRRSMI